MNVKTNRKRPLTKNGEPNKNYGARLKYGKGIEGLLRAIMNSKTSN